MFLGLTRKAASFVVLLIFRYATTLLLIQNGSRSLGFCLPDETRGAVSC